MHRTGTARRRLCLEHCRRCRRRTPQEEVDCWVELKDNFSSMGWGVIPLNLSGWHCYTCGRTDVLGIRKRNYRILSWTPLQSVRALAVK